MNKKRVLTGVTTTGIPDRQYVGAIRPAIRASHRKHRIVSFLADYHDPDQMPRPAIDSRIHPRRGRHLARLRPRPRTHHVLPPERYSRNHGIKLDTHLRYRQRP